jgi:hypothetical protein
MDALRYRAEDVMRSITRSSIKEVRLPVGHQATHNICRDILSSIFRLHHFIIN